MISVSKEKSLISFKFEDGKVCKYDLKDNSCYSPLGNKVVNLNKYFRNKDAATIIESIKEEPYRLWFSFTKRQAESGYYFSNMGSVLKHLKTYSSAEQIFSAGIKEICWYSIAGQKVPKSVIKFCRRNDIKLDGDVIEAVNCLGVDKCQEIFDAGFFNLVRDFENLVDGYNYCVSGLINYFQRLNMVEGIDINHNFMYIFTDYVSDASELREKYVRYPKNFLTTKQIINKQYQQNKKEIDEKRFSKISSKNQNLTKTIGDYVFIYPEKGEHIQDEGKQQQHCVASYVKYVLDGSRHIILMRDKQEPESSLITVCLNSELELHHVAGKFNRELTPPENQVLDKYLEQIK